MQGWWGGRLLASDGPGSGRGEGGARRSGPQPAGAPPAWPHQKGMPGQQGAKSCARTRGEHHTGQARGEKRRKAAQRADSWEGREWDPTGGGLSPGAEEAGGKGWSAAEQGPAAGVGGADATGGHETARTQGAGTQRLGGGASLEEPACGGLSRSQHGQAAAGHGTARKSPWAKTQVSGPKRSTPRLGPVPTLPPCMQSMSFMAEPAGWRGGEKREGGNVAPQAQMQMGQGHRAQQGEAVLGQAGSEVARGQMGGAGSALGEAWLGGVARGQGAQSRQGAGTKGLAAGARR
jgi:hypothetical protein